MPPGPVAIVDGHPQWGPLGRPRCDDSKGSLCLWGNRRDWEEWPTEKGASRKGKAETKGKGKAEGKGKGKEEWPEEETGRRKRKKDKGKDQEDRHALPNSPGLHISTLHP